MPSKTTRKSRIKMISLHPYPLFQNLLFGHKALIPIPNTNATSNVWGEAAIIIIGFAYLKCETIGP
jgi:hypothetical protein